MNIECLYTLNSPYRESLNVKGFKFGGGKKAIAVVGAMRGNEVQQMYICSKLIGELKKLEASGRLAADKQILVVPCINYYSMNIGKRFWAMDNTDINRMFPGYNLGETTQRIAAGVFEKLQGFEYGVQLASFYQRGKFIPHVRLMETGFTDKELMKRFGLQYGIVRTPRPYDTTTLNYNWQIWETKAFSLYSNETDNLDETSAKTAVAAILRFMSASGIINQKIPNGYNTEIVEGSGITQVRSKSGGLFLNRAVTGACVEKGEALGKIEDPLDGKLLETVRATETGIIYFTYDKPLINENTVCYKIIKDY